jgi:hypothetical protein
MATGVLFWVNRQYIIDTVAVASFQPSAQIMTIANRAHLSKDGRFYFYASRPQIESSSKFNNDCQRKEAKSPILGCYNGLHIYLFDVTDERLDGIEEVTAAHEMLHAVYDRLGDADKQRIDMLLQQAYDRVKTKELASRMAYYNRAEPGEFNNELHSILPTEFSNLGPDLESYYGKYFSNRDALISLHAKVEKQFNILSTKASTLIKQIDELAISINNSTRQYNQQSTQLSQDIQSFNNRASSTGGFSSKAEFESERALLSSRSEQLDLVRQQIEQKILTYKDLLTQLNTINSEAASLNQSLDSTLTPAPKL